MCDCEMAIPFNLPSDEQTEDNYRRLDQLLVDLYAVLRQILIRPRCSTQDVSRASAPGSDDVTAPRVLPDLVSSTLAPPAACQCVCARRRRRRGCPRRPRPEDGWLVAGEQLRKIAEELRATFIRKQETAEEEKSQPQPELKVEVKSSGLFSLLVPAQFRSSLWTTVFLLVGWRLLSRVR